MKEMKYSEIIKANRELGKRMSGPPYTISLLSNIVVAQLKDVLEYSLRTCGINAQVAVGNYDNVAQDSGEFQDKRAMVIFWEPANFIDGGHYRIDLLGPKEFEDLQSRMRGEIDLVLSNAANCSLVLLNRFSPLVFSHSNIRQSNFERLCDNLNRYVEAKGAGNVKVVDIERIFCRLSVEKCVDLRYYYSSKALYSISFYKEYAEFIKPYVLSANGKSKKALIFDCDNTLWKGILGEEGIDGIEMSSDNKDGAIFREVQTIAAGLAGRGVILGLCSKNEPEEVNNVLQNSTDMVLTDKHLTIKKVNWSDKVSNLSEIAAELNIGTDSIVFVDDSSFEINYVRQFLPEITTVQVPAAIHEYPGVMREIARLFYNLSETPEDLLKAQMYKQQVLRKTEQQRFENLVDYLRSLNLRVRIHLNDESLIPRVSQLTQKTNQFNLTTKRYTEQDIQAFIKAGSTAILALEAMDKFGEYGLTGLCIARMNADHLAHIDTFLMSCRIIGRDIELAFFDFVVDYLRNSGTTSIDAEYVRTLKNDQVATFYDKLGFSLVSESGGEKIYRLDILEYRPGNVDYIEVASAR
ncbi:MAG: HAD-IIIC family phosphatase [Desulfomonile tiedjei]|nr:HAD-IIIC family phosphatase [Desulfomonile tiedjei]